MNETAHAPAVIVNETPNSVDTDFTADTAGSITEYIMLDSPVPPMMPFYASYVVFFKAMKVLKSGELPRRITSGTFSTLGDDASRVVRGFWAMGLIDEAGFPTEDFRVLVAAFQTHRWPEALRKIIASAYAYVPLNELGEMTRQQLTEIFVARAGRQPDAMRNAETFFLCLVSEAGLTMAGELSKRAVRGVTEAHRWLRLADLDAVPPPRNVSAPVEPEKRKQHSVVLSSLLAELATLLSDDDMTAEEKRGAIAFMALIGRRLKREQNE